MLLMPERMDGRNAVTVADLKRLEDEDLDGVPCYRMMWDEGQVATHGKRATRHNREVVWVDQRTFLLRRIEYCWWFDGPDRWRTRADFWPELNVPIPKEELENGLHP